MPKKISKLLSSWNKSQDSDSKTKTKSLDGWKSTKTTKNSSWIRYSHFKTKSEISVISSGLRKGNSKKRKNKPPLKHYNSKNKFKPYKTLTVNWERITIELLLPKKPLSSSTEVKEIEEFLRRGMRIMLREWNGSS